MSWFPAGLNVEAEGRCLFAAQTAAAAAAVECGVNSLGYATVSCSLFLLSAVLIVVIIQTSCLLYYSTICILYFLDLASDVVVVASGPTQRYLLHIIIY